MEWRVGTILYLYINKIFNIPSNLYLCICLWLVHIWSMLRKHTMLLLNSECQGVKVRNFKGAVSLWDVDQLYIFFLSYQASVQVFLATSTIDCGHMKLKWCLLLHTMHMVVVVLQLFIILTQRPEVLCSLAVHNRELGIHYHRWKYQRGCGKKQNTPTAHSRNKL